MKFKKLKIIGKRPPRAIEKHSLYFELKDACDSRRCPICLLLNQKEQQHIESIFYEHVNDSKVREKFREAQGLCSDHVKLFLKYGDALGLAIFANDLVYHFIETSNGSFESSICPLCQSNAQTETRLVQAFVDYLALDEFWQAVENSVGLCQWHLRLIGQLSPDKELKLKLLNFQKEKLAEHQALLESFIEKNNFTVPHEDTTDAEAQSYQLVWKLLRIG